MPGDRLGLLVLNLLFCDDSSEDAGPEELRLPASYHFKKGGCGSYAPRPEVMEEKVLKTGMRVKVVRSVSGRQANVFTVPSVPGGYVVE
jgi:hypothetical protein